MFCSQCGRKLPTEELLPFCPYCGIRLEGEDIPAEAAGPEAAPSVPKKNKWKPLFIAAAALAALMICGLLFTTLFFLKRWRDASADPRSRQASAITLSPAAGTGTIYPGDTVSLEMKLYPPKASPGGAEWSSSDLKIATVDGNGNVRFMAEGTALITVRLGNGVEGEIELTASKKPYRLTIGETYLELQIMSSHTFVPLVAPEGAEYDGIVWESSDRSILRVDQDGTVTGVGQGLATVTATVADTVIAQADVFVYKYRFDVLTNYVVRHGQRFTQSNGRLEYYITLDYKEDMQNGKTVMRHTYLSYFPDADRALLGCDITDDDSSFVYQTMIFLEKNNKTSLNFELYCYFENGSFGRDVPLSAVGGINIDGNGKIGVEGYKPGDALDFYKYEGDESFRENALEIAGSLVGDSLRALHDCWDCFGLGYSMKELTGFDFD